MSEKIRDTFNRLKDYCEKESFIGYDPYDGLNSFLFQSIPFLSKNRIVRLAWIQTFKRSPINLRVLFGIKKSYNPKAIGLFLSGYCRLYKNAPLIEYLEKIEGFSEQLLSIANMEWSGACWGYNFEWQARAFYLPKNTPTVVVTGFVGNALLDAYEITKDKKLLLTARSACDFILIDLKRNYDSKGNFAFSYSPFDESIVFNASLWGSQLLSRVYSFTLETELLVEAKKAVEFCCDRQKLNGSWGYGEYKFHQWIDSFHSGYNLECISDYVKYSGDTTFENNVKIGFDYYINNFFTSEGISKYYDNSTFPIDIHAPAQMVITLSKLNKFNEQKEKLDKVLNWTIDHMVSREGFFYYQINKYFSSKVPYMRWAQAWMFYALSEYLLLMNEKT